jgi:hypothetical protein
MKAQHSKQNISTTIIIRVITRDSFTRLVAINIDKGIIKGIPGLTCTTPSDLLRAVHIITCFFKS